MAPHLGLTRGPGGSTHHPPLYKGIREVLRDVADNKGEEDDIRKLKKAETKLQQKATDKDTSSNPTGSTALTKKETRKEAKGTNNCKYIPIENLCTAYGNKQLLCSVNLFTRERIKLNVGENSAGKTTLLKILTGELNPNSQGGVALVSYDERLIRMICKELWVCAGDGSVRSIEGGFDEHSQDIAET
ncbi:hypothetical protein DAPPUDRAFT_247555 [Daphnia pulex]|uniref:ABC transporter domain-containing protein n=1 Tax=Daphnia pulex TaxID=6669 RepID=E9GSP6_DAPPU|nr:hypothetical protein DAPPUDRAFT_247555 [Daphnia pulex]|eukprot:EFX77465.1 hypothetical protein DAPPUDRAFT_247555 [Daphnia pulex]